MADTPPVPDWSQISPEYRAAAGLTAPVLDPGSGPQPLDDAAAQRLHAMHASTMASIDPEDPANPYFGKFDLAERHRAKTREDYEALLMRAGVEPPRPPTPTQIAEEHFAAQWQSAETPFPDSMAASIDGQLDIVGALPAAERTARAADLRRELGAERYDRLVAEAKSSLLPSKWSDAMSADKFVLENLAALGRYNAAYQRARAASRLPR